MVIHTGTFDKLLTAFSNMHTEEPGKHMTNGQSIVNSKADTAVRFREYGLF